jgi:hypothetical protein
LRRLLRLSQAPPAWMKLMCCWVLSGPLDSQIPVQSQSLVVDVLQQNPPSLLNSVDERFQATCPPSALPELLSGNLPGKYSKTVKSRQIPDEGYQTQLTEHIVMMWPILVSSTNSYTSSLKHSERNNNNAWSCEDPPTVH